jgi:YfiH family protein
MSDSRRAWTTNTRPPQPAAGFDWHRASWGWQLRAADLSSICVHGWSTRQLALEAVSADAAGWARVADELGVEVGRLHRLRQVHGAAVYRAKTLRPSQSPDADIAVSNEAPSGLAVQVADCVPLLLADSATGAVAASHAGWRGTAADVAGVTVRALAAAFGVRSEEPVAAIGPSIGPCCYQVGADVRDAFAAHGHAKASLEAWFLTRPSGLFLDLWTANADLLARAGIAPERVWVSRLCTACHADWFPSYRRDGQGAGRIAGYIRSSGR